MFYDDFDLHSFTGSTVTSLCEGSGALYPNAGRALLEAGAGIIIFGDTAASKIVIDAVKKATEKKISLHPSSDDEDLEKKRASGEGNTPGDRVDAAIETLENALEGVVRLAASSNGDQEKDAQAREQGATSKRELIEAAKLLFCNF